MDYEKKIADQQKEINRLKEQLEGAGQVDRISNAILLSLLVAMGVDEQHPAALRRDDINATLAAMDDSIHLVISPTPDGYSMHYSVNE